MFPISKIILQAIDGSKENKLGIVKNLGFKNLNKGVRRIEHLIHTGQCPESLRDRLPFALGLESETIQQALKDTLIKQKEEEEESRIRREEQDRSSFQPHIWIKHELENPPLGSICIVGFVGVEHWKVIQLPEDINHKPWSEQFRAVRGKIREHQNGKNVDRSMFGGVMGYLYRKTYDDSFFFSIDGAIIEIYSSKIPHIDIQVRIRQRELQGRVFKHTLVSVP